MLTLKTILVATDFSDSARAALDQARALAGACSVPLHVLHVVTEPLHELWAGYAPAAEIIGTIDRLEADARHRLERMVSPDDLAGGRVVVAAEWGDPVEEILKYASSHNIDLIVCGTHGRRGWSHLVIGSVAENVVRLAPCPVLTVPACAAAAAAA